ncbi:hypothetical protein Mgra_00000713 [Meloidogyne graminicola]|uniref:Uncharacterized protein n=1 Tax=Meloidogyne graminicola TaxID=189291 RepID=A0A8T0A4C9_9BILA|nr:hypothetical protein Mgra_00000713 [Meloidogyne graminicola]
MDDILTSLIDNNEPTKNNRKFESAQSRYLRLHVPLKDVEWNVCDYCGEIVHQMVFERHLIFHELAGLTYDFYHHEISVEKRRIEQNKKIQIKEAKAKRRSLGLELSSCSSSLPSSSENSENNSDSETDTLSSTNSSTIYPDNIKFEKNEEFLEENKKSINTADWIMEELMNEKIRKRQRKMLNEDEYGFNYFDQQEADFLGTEKKRSSKKLIKIKKEVEIKGEDVVVDEKASLRDEYEHLLCLKNLGRRYEYAVGEDLICLI